MAEKRSGSAFLTMFVPGLVIGLVVGGLAGAFLAPVLESGNMNALTQDPSKPITTPPGARHVEELPASARDDGRAPTADPAADPGTPKPEEKPAEKAPEKPVETPKQPG